MPYKDREKQKQAQREHYLRNKELYIKRGVNRKYRVFGGSRKRYEELPELVPTLYQQITAAGWDTPQSIADKYGVPEATVRNACYKGRLTYFKLGRFRVVEPEDAEYWNSNRRRLRVAETKQRVRDEAVVTKPTKIAKIQATLILQYEDEFEYAEKLLNFRDDISGQFNVENLEIHRDQ